MSICRQRRGQGNQQYYSAKDSQHGLSITLRGESQWSLRLSRDSPWHCGISKAELQRFSKSRVPTVEEGTATPLRVAQAQPLQQGPCMPCHCSKRRLCRLSRYNTRSGAEPMQMHWVQKRQGLPESDSAPSRPVGSSRIWKLSSWNVFFLKKMYSS